MSDAQSLSEAVAAIEEQAERKAASEKIDQKVAEANGTVSNLNSDVQDLADELHTLQYHRQIFVDMFDDDEPPTVESALQEAKDAVDVDRSIIVEGLVENSAGGPETPINNVRKEVTGAKSSVNNAEEEVKNRLRGHQSEWEERLSSARDLQEVIGEQNDEFVRTVDWLEEIVTEKMWEADHSAASVIREWENATAQWEDHQDLQGLDSFQQTHGLSDDAVDAVERLSSHAHLTLDDVDLEVLEELKGIEQLAQAVELEI